MRIWQESLDDLLAAGPGLAPLALLTNEAHADLPDALQRLQTRLHQDGVPDSVERSVLGLAYVLCGLRYTPEQVENLYRNLNMTLEDSTTYQHILQKGVAQGLSQGLSEGLSQGLSQGLTQGFAQGRLETMRALILRLGTKRFGQPSATISATILGITDASRLEWLAVRVLDANDWDELLATA